MSLMQFCIQIYQKYKQLRRGMNKRKQFKMFLLTEIKDSAKTTYLIKYSS